MALAIALLCSAGAWAQTDVTSTYLTNADFSATTPVTGTYLYGYGKDGSPYGFQTVDGWTSVVTKGVSDSGFANSGMAGGVFSYGSSTALKGNNKAAPATNPNGEASGNCLGFFGVWGCGGYYYQGVTLNPGNYTIIVPIYNQSGTQANTTYTGFFPTSGTEKTVAINTTVGSWVNQKVSFTLEEATPGQIRVGYQSTGNGSGVNPHIFIDGVTIIYTDFKAELRTVIAQAQAINARISTLGDDITTAQTTLNNASASKTAIESAVSTLRSAISTKLGAYTGLDAAGDEITSFIVNNGFETSPTFDGTSLGSGSDPKSNATPTAGSTLLYNSTNVYQVNGWELMTTETLDYARTFTMPYDKTLYVQSNNAVAGQAVAAPTNGSSVTTDNSNLLFVEANWCENAVLGVKQTIPLRAGSYRLTFDSYVTTSVANANSLCGVSYAETTNYKWPAATNTWTNNEIDFTLNAQTDVTISMGYKKINSVGGGSSAFLFVDNVKLTYFDPLKLAQIQWQAVHDALADLDATLLPDAAEAAITTELAKAVPTTTVEDVNDAKAALQALIDSYADIKAAYEKLSALIDLTNSEKENSTGDKTDFAAAISTATGNIETRTAADVLTNDYNTLEEARETYVTGGAQPTAGHVFDYTFKIPDAAITNANDWTSKRLNYNQQYTGAPDNAYFDNNNENRNIQKNIGTLRLGKYELKCATRAHADVTVGNIYVSQNAANLNQTDINHIGATGGELGNGWSWTIVPFDNYKDDKDITLGFYSECGSSKWAGADDFHLYYKGNVVDDETANALKATVVSGKMNATVASTQATALSNFESEQTFENYNTLKRAIDAASNSKAVYETLNTAITNAEGWTTNATSVTDPMRLKYNNGSYSDETTANDIYAEYQAAEITALVAASASNWTSAIINASFETGDKTGWTATSRNDTGVKETNNATYSITSGDITSGSYMFNSWGGTAENDVKQTIKNLPAGTYTLVAVLAGFPGESLVIAANEETGTTVVAGDKTVGYLTSVTFTLAEAADVIIKASNTKSQTGSDASFIKADNFQLYVGSSVPASASKPNLLYAINNATNARKSANEGAGVFQIPAAAGTELAGAISIAQAVYDNASATLEQINQAVTDVDAARTTYEGTELNAPDSEKRYTLTIHWDSKDFDGYNVTFNHNARADQGLYGIKYIASDVNRGQAFKFTPVGGNKYKVSFLTPVGTEQYITTNNLAYGSNKSQIRTTDDESKALEIEIKLTSTENQFQLYNTDANAVIASSGNDDMYTQNSANFSISEAAQVSVTVSCKAGKYGTVIFPFKPDVSTDFDYITFYSISELNDGKLTLAEVGDPVANTPYIIKNDDSNNFSKTLQGFGTAKQNEYTDAAGLLTGFYTAQEIAAGNYVLQTQGGVQAFYRLAEDATANQVYRAYLTVPDAGDVKAFYFDFNDATAIAKIQDSGSKIQDSEIYNLAGQRLNKAQKGVNIINGKKVLVK